LDRVNPDVIFCDTLQAPVTNPEQMPVDVYKKEQVRALLSPQAQDTIEPSPDVVMQTSNPRAPSNQQAISPGAVAVGTWGAPLLPGMEGTSTGW
ncbi:unnamed protein product, partial [Symbiodinium sp. CCMP2456]